MKTLKDLKLTILEANVDGEQLMDLIKDFLQETSKGSTMRSEFNGILKDNDYYHVNDLDEVNDRDFQREAENRGYIHEDNIAMGEGIEELVKTHSKRNIFRVR